MTHKADEKVFIVVYSQGAGSALTWNAGHCCEVALEQNVDDVGFIRALIMEFGSNPRIDQKRIYAPGLSYGGAMVHKLGAELSDQFAAIADLIWEFFANHPKS